MLAANQGALLCHTVQALKTSKKPKSAGVPDCARAAVCMVANVGCIRSMAC